MNIKFILILALAFNAFGNLAVAQDDDGEIHVKPGQVVEIALPAGVIASRNYPTEITRLSQHGGVVFNVKSYIWDLDVYMTDFEEELTLKSLDLVRGKIIFEGTVHNGFTTIAIVAKKGHMIQFTAANPGPLCVPVEGCFRYDPKNPDQTYFFYYEAMPFSMTPEVGVRTDWVRPGL